MFNSPSRFGTAIGTALLAVAVLFAASASARAAYLTDVALRLEQPDGTRLELLASGDEFYNWVHDAAGRVIVQDPASGWWVYAVKQQGRLVASPYVVGRDDAAAAEAVQPGLMPDPEVVRSARQAFEVPAAFDEKAASGATPPVPQAMTTVNNIVVFIRFSDDLEFTDLAATVAGKFNGSAAGANSLYNYFREVSYGIATISSTLVPTPPGATVVSYQDANPRGYYTPYNATTNPLGYTGGNDGAERRVREHGLLQRAVEAIAAQVPAGLELDTNLDGRVDNVVFIVRGGNTGWSSLLWPHMWSLYSVTANINGKRVYAYNFQLETMLTVSVLCHEMFHTLGAPDLYHYSSSGSPVANWDLMGSNSEPAQHTTCLMKQRYGGWIASIPKITTAGTYSLNPITSPTGQCYRIDSPYSSTEYFVLEFRKKAAAGLFESQLPGSGLIVARIDPALRGNAGGPPDEVYIYRPGGTTTANGTTSSAHLSSETGRTALNDSTNPTSFLQSGDLGGLRLSNVGSSAGGTISFQVAFDAPPCPLMAVPAGTTLYRKLTYPLNARMPSGCAARSATATLLRGAAVDSTLAVGLAVPAGAPWTVPTAQALAADYRLRLTDLGNGAVYDASQTFTVADLPAGDIRLESGVPVSGALGGASAGSAWLHHYIDVPPGATSLSVSMNGLTADADLYVRSISRPTTAAADCKSENGGSSPESCTIANPSVGTWWVSATNFDTGVLPFTVTATILPTPADWFAQDQVASYHLLATTDAVEHHIGASDVDRLRALGNTEAVLVRIDPAAARCSDLLGVEATLPLVASSEAVWSQPRNGEPGLRTLVAVGALGYANYRASCGL